MNHVLTLTAALLIAAACDWVAVTRIGAYYTDFDYRYWPLSRQRQFGFGALLVATALVSLSGPVLVLIPAAILVAIWALTGVRDINAQRTTGDIEAPRYSDGDY